MLPHSVEYLYIALQLVQYTIYCTVVSAYALTAVVCTNYGTRSTFDLPMQSGTFLSYNAVLWVKQLPFLLISNFFNHKQIAHASESNFVLGQYHISEPQ